MSAGVSTPPSARLYERSAALTVIAPVPRTTGMSIWPILSARAIPSTCTRMGSIVVVVVAMVVVVDASVVVVAWVGAGVAIANSLSDAGVAVHEIAANVSTNPSIERAKWRSGRTEGA